MMNFAPSGIAERDYLQKVRVRSSPVHPLTEILAANASQRRWKRISRLAKTK